MAKSPRALPPDLTALVHTLNTKVSYSMAVGATAIMLGAYAVWELNSNLGDLNRSIGVVEGANRNSEQRSVLDLLGDINSTLKSQQQPVPESDQDTEKQGALDAPSAMRTGLQGFKVSKDALAEALPEVPASGSAIWVYTDDTATAEVFRQLAEPDE